MNLDDLTLGQLKEIGALFNSNNVQPPKNTNGELQIVVLPRGHVLVGNLYTFGNDCELRNASTVRRWGTDSGLGQLAIEGPQENTILDREGVARFNLQAIVKRIDCNPGSWK